MTEPSANDANKDRAAEMIADTIVMAVDKRIKALMVQIVEAGRNGSTEDKLFASFAQHVIETVDRNQKEPTWMAEYAALHDAKPD